MKNKIIKLLEDNAQVRKLTCGEMLELIDRDDFENIAEEIVKLFAIPVVVNNEVTCCDNPKLDKGMKLGFGKDICYNCGGHIAT